MPTAQDIRFNFIVRADSDEHLQALCRLDVDRDWDIFAGGEHCWSLQTYLLLRQAGVPVICSRDLVPGCVNLGHAASLGILEPRRDAFVVSLQADFPRVAWANLHIVENKAQLRDETTYWLPLWPQAGLIGREPSRDGVRRVAYSGRIWMLAGTPEEWTRDLRTVGCEFAHLDERNWNDFSEVDVLLAMRSFDQRPYNTKPPTKLLNAWLAGIPLVAGWDSAFSQVGTPSVDYFRVATRKEALAAIRRLREDDALYRAVVARGRERAGPYSRERIVRRWIDLLQKQVAARYGAWLSRGPESRVAWACRVLAARAGGGLRAAARKALQRWAGREAVDRLRLLRR